jgi:hypothetical protein
MSMRAIYLCSTLIVLTASASQINNGPPATYYVSTEGSDWNSGTSASPWKTIQQAANALKPGDTAIIAKGNYDERIRIKNSGRADALITLKAEGAVMMRGFNIQGSYVEVEGFEIANIGGTELTNRSSNSGVFISGSHVIVSNTHIRDTNAEAIYIANTSSGDVLRSNRIVNAIDAGIYVQGKDHLIVSNDISHTVQIHGGMTKAGDADGIRFFGSGSTFRKNYVHDITLSDTGNRNAHIDAFQTWGPCEDMIIEQNTILLDGTGQGITIEGMSQPTGNITIRNNLFMTTGTGYAPAVNAGDVGLVTNVNIVNNTMVALNGPAEYAIWLFQNLRGTVVKNNAIYDHGNSKTPYVRIERGASGLNIGSNAISKSDGKTPAGSPYPGDLWMVNPQFVNFTGRDFHLKPSSPLISSGAILSNVPNDFDDVARPVGQAHDIGAYKKE